MPLPTLSRITLYPIKSLPGAEVEMAEVTVAGALAHDRRFALLGPDGKFLNAKRHPLIHQVRTRFAADLARVEVRIGDEVHAAALDDRAAMERIAAAVGRHLGTTAELVEDRTSGNPDDLDASGPTVVARASLERVAAWFGIDLGQVRRRFRANLELDGAPPFWEDRLVPEPGQPPQPFQIGDVALVGEKICQRCPVPGRDPDSGEPLAGFQKEFVARREAELPPESPRGRFDHFYRLTVNTRVLPQGCGLRLHLGDPLTF